ncbi:MAG: bifunctional diguanylate cyclase/phosphodiesterase [Actinomycetota bacterium]|nr:bifunctional diguanylate cyclase/phosphodiesterase [Actinomycetota bacterium]
MQDQLTGLASRDALLAELGRALSSSRRSGRATAVLMIGLDRFTEVNEALGRRVGDELLRAAAERIKATVRGSDLVARAGSDEFLVVIRELSNPTEPVRAAMRIINEFHDALEVFGNSLFTTVSVGVAIASDQSEPEIVIHEAETAMATAKSEGRDQMAFFNSDIQAAVLARVTAENQLSAALEREELHVWYQPEIDLESGEIRAVEALIRWLRPGCNMRLAEEFIRTAEDTGLILEIGSWVIEQSFHQAANWAIEHPERALLVRVNVSALQLSMPTLLDTMDRALISSSVRPELLCFEITETALLRPTPTVRANVFGIRDRGIRIAIDDFGTGFASLAYLREYPVDVVKIDRSFVANVLTSDIDRRLIAGIVALAREFGLHVTAEGVENADQAAYLRSVGCPSAQGFLYSEAVPPSQISELFKNVYLHS